MRRKLGDAFRVVGAISALDWVWEKWLGIGISASTTIVVSDFLYGLGSIPSPWLEALVVVTTVLTTAIVGNVIKALLPPTAGPPPPLPPAAINVKDSDIKTEGSYSPVIIASAGAVVTIGSVDTSYPSTSALPASADVPTPSSQPHDEPWEVEIGVLDEPNTVNAGDRAKGGEWCHFKVTNVSLMELTTCSLRVMIAGQRHDLVWPNPDRGYPLARATLPARSETQVPIVMRGWTGHGYCPTLQMDPNTCYVSGIQLLTQCSIAGTVVGPGQYAVTLEVDYHVAGRLKQASLPIELTVPASRTSAIRIMRASA